MSRKKSGRKAAQKFMETAARIEAFCAEVVDGGLSDQAVTWSYEAALIKTYVAFEQLMLDCIVVAINNDTTTISSRTGISFPKHLTDEVCEYLVTGGGYFDFKGRDGLIQIIKKNVPPDHWLVKAVKQERFTHQLDIMMTLRNYAAHGSSVSKRKALEAVGQDRIGSAGSWLKSQGRFTKMITNLRDLAREIETQAPY